MNAAEKKFEELESLIAAKLGSRRTRELHYAIRAMCVTELDEENHDENFGAFLAENHSESVTIAGIEYSIGEALMRVDPDRYEESKREFMAELTMNCGFYYFYEDQLQDMIDFIRSSSLETIYETVYPTEVAI